MINFARIIVGILFIFSGLVKANDPLGLSYKMQEFFELWKMQALNDYSLAFSIIIIAFEIIAGVALLLGWKMRIFSWLLLLLTVFFTFLTGYAYLSGKFKNCGCFGDCIPISPLTSFIKDIVLLLLIVPLFIARNRIRQLFSDRVSGVIMLAVTMLSVWIQFYTLKHLPFFDCLPYKRNNNISQKMQMPANAIPDSTVILFKYKKNGKPVEFTADDFPADFDSTYTDMQRIDKLVRKGKNNEPPIKGFALTTRENIDSASSILQLPVAGLLFAETFPSGSPAWVDEMKQIKSMLASDNAPVYLVTSNRKAAEDFISRTGLSLPVFTLDYTALRTAARANPTFYLLRNGTIRGKWSYADLEDAISEIKKK